MRILIADDDFASRKILGKTVTSLGEVEYACNGEEAWAAVSEAHRAGEPFDLILLDIMMPGLDGHEVLRKVRALEACSGLAGTDRCRIAMATSRTDAQSVVGSFREECDGYIVKPFTRDSVLRDLRNYWIIP